jgi:hypothetical protein
MAIVSGERPSLWDRMNRPLHGENPSRSRIIVWRIAAVGAVLLAVTGVFVTSEPWLALSLLVPAYEVPRMSTAKRRVYLGERIARVLDR